jgi:hypothetical protein
MRENTTGFFKPKSKEKTPSLDERIASDPGRAKQDMQAAKERESDKGRIIKQVADAKSESSVRSNPQYEKSSTNIADQIPTKAPKAKSSGLTKEELSAESNIPYRGQAAKETTSAKPTMKSAPTSKYRGGRSEEDINRMIAEATPDKMRATQFEKDNPDATPYKKGGMVKSGASRGDGCAQRGRTKGKYC